MLGQRPQHIELAVDLGMRNLAAVGIHCISQAATHAVALPDTTPIGTPIRRPNLLVNEPGLSFRRHAAGSRLKVRLTDSADVKKYFNARMLPIKNFSDKNRFNRFPKSVRLTKVVVFIRFRFG